MSSLQDKLNNYEVVPPASVWDKVAVSLDEDAADRSYSSKLYNLEQAPPVSAWETINSTLHPEGAKVVPLRKRATQFYRYAVAAIVIALASLGIIKWIAGATHPGPAGVAVVAPGNTAITPKATANPAQQLPANEQPKEETSTPGETPELEQVEQPARTHLQRAVNPGVSTASYDQTSADVDNNPIYAYEDHAPNIADRYIMLMTPDGKFIRMSKKLGSLVCCVSGEEQDPDCKDQIKKWQEKIATSTATRSSGNFLDILNLVNTLDDSNGL